MSYKVKEIFLSLQGEGAQSGRTAIFCRFTGCNLWSGREKDRASSSCRFCDTDFRGTDGTLGGRYQLEELVSLLLSLWPEQTSESQPPYVIFTGGEPSLQLDQKLVDACHSEGILIGIETNGTRALPYDLNWVCVSPKPRSELTQRRGNELKLVFPQPEEQMKPEHFSSLDFEHFYLQPMDGPQLQKNIAAAIDYCLTHPQWKLSLQRHKTLQLR